MQIHSIVKPLSSPSFFPLSPSPRPPRFPTPNPRKPYSFQPLRLSKPHNPAFSSPFDGSSDLELLGKPSLSPPSDDSSGEADPSDPPKPPELEEALAPFLKFFKSPDGSDSDPESEEETGVGAPAPEKEKQQLVAVEYYDPKAGDLVVGVVVSGNENKLDVNVGADSLGTMLTKEVLPLYDGEMDYLTCDLEKDREEFMMKGKIGVVKDEEAMSGGRAPRRPVVEVGTVLFAEVLGRTLSGRPLLSSRRLFRRIAWHRVRQVLSLPP